MIGSSGFFITGFGTGTVIGVGFVLIIGSVCLTGGAGVCGNGSMCISISGDLGRGFGTTLGLVDAIGAGSLTILNNKH